MNVLVVDNDKSLGARLVMMMASAGISASMFDELPVKHRIDTQSHIRHQGNKEIERRRKRLAKEPTK